MVRYSGHRHNESPAGVNRFLFFLFFASSHLLSRDTPACAREHPSLDGSFAVVDLCFVSTLPAQPWRFITLVLPTKHLFDPDGPS
jgi:hypothetical protein